MKKLSTLLILALMVASAGIFAVTSVASAQSVPNEVDAADGRGHGSRWLSRDEKKAIKAGALNMTVEELQAAKDAGQSMEEIITAQGLTTEEYEAALQAGLIAAANQAVTDGELTQEQADTIIANIESGNFGFGNHHGNSGSRWLSRDEKRAIIAGALGMTVEELEAAKDSGQSMSEIIEAQGMTTEQYEAALQTALIEAANQAVTDGELTQEEADTIIANLENGMFGFGCNGHGWHSGSDSNSDNSSDDTTPADDATPADDTANDDGTGTASRVDQQLPVRIFIPLVSQNA